MQAAVFATTSTIGLRVVPVGKVALERTSSSVEVLGGRVGVKVAVSGGRVVNVSVEYEDVAALARELGVAGQGGPARGHRRRREAACPVGLSSDHRDRGGSPAASGRADQRRASASARASSADRAAGGPRAAA